MPRPEFVAEIGRLMGLGRAQALSMSKLKAPESMTAQRQTKTPLPSQVGG